MDNSWTQRIFLVDLTVKFLLLWFAMIVCRSVLWDGKFLVVWWGSTRQLSWDFWGTWCENNAWREDLHQQVPLVQMETRPRRTHQREMQSKRLKFEKESTKVTMQIPLNSLQSVFLKGSSCIQKIGQVFEKSKYSWLPWSLPKLAKMMPSLYPPETQERYWRESWNRRGRTEGWARRGNSQLLRLKRKPKSLIVTWSFHKDQCFNKKDLGSTNFVDSFNALGLLG